MQVRGISYDVVMMILLEQKRISKESRDKQDRFREIYINVDKVCLRLRRLTHRYHHHC